MCRLAVKCRRQIGHCRAGIGHAQQSTRFRQIQRLLGHHGHGPALSGLGGEFVSVHLRPAQRDEEGIRRDATRVIFQSLDGVGKFAGGLYLRQSLQQCRQFHGLWPFVV